MGMRQHSEESVAMYVEVLLPLALARHYTYAVPLSLADAVLPGVRVDVQFGKKRRYTALVLEVKAEPGNDKDIKPIQGVVDERPIVFPFQLAFWRWMAQYYACSMGEVMAAALPAHFRLVSETLVMAGEGYQLDVSLLDDKEYLIMEALGFQRVLRIQQIQDIVQQRSVWPLIRQMLEKRYIALEEDMQERYRPRKVTCLRLCSPYAEDPAQLRAAFGLVAKAGKQTEALMAYIQLSREAPLVRKQEVCRKAGVDSGVVGALCKKGILEPFELEVSRLIEYGGVIEEAGILSGAQEVALEAIRKEVQEKEVVLLQGVTGSGKTRIYTELMREAIAAGDQVLYLLPEIALTSQVIGRLRRIFGDEAAIYHSRLNNNERVEVWQQVLGGKSIVLGARSAVFLPFQRLKWVIVDEEHDASFKQQEPAPRYQGRDAAIYLAHLYGARVVLGTATPSVETYYNVQTRKYGLVRLSERFGGLELPAIRLVDLKPASRNNQMHGHFSAELLAAIAKTLEKGEQVILFQNRRGFSPAYRCTSCSWHASCVHCDVSLTYHKSGNQLKCHYCNYKSPLPLVCPTCGGTHLALQGFGTEKIEEELKIYFPDVSVGRLDYDTARGKYAHTQIIQEFDEGRLQILVGTQMVTKGLDFERVGLVGILSADQLLQFPDFRASERAYQLMTQVSGRAGRKFQQGQVLIQAFQTAHPVLQDVLEQRFDRFFQRELGERKQFSYPPFFRLIRITLRHQKPDKVDEAAAHLHAMLAPRLGDQLKGPAMPSVGRVRGLYILDFLLKLEKGQVHTGKVKSFIQQCIAQVTAMEGLSGLRSHVDVDPY